MDRQQPTRTTTVVRVLVLIAAVTALCLLSAGVAVAAQQHGGAHGRMHAYVAQTVQGQAPATIATVPTKAAPRAHKLKATLVAGAPVATGHGNGSGLAALVAIVCVTAFLCVLALAGGSRARSAVTAADTVALPQRRQGDQKTPHLAA